MGTKSVGVSIVSAVVLLSPVFTFNLDLNNPQIYHSGIPNDYFGFNVALHGDDTKNNAWMMIGAPRRNDTRRPNVQQPGVTLKCPFNKTCSEIQFDTGKESTNKGDSNGAMLGSAQDIYGDRFVTCAPRWKELGVDRYTVFGQCYWGETNDISMSAVMNIQPLSNNDSYLGFQLQGAVSRVLPYFAYGQSGFAAHFPNINQNPNMMVLGAPGILNWKGSTLLYRDANTEARSRKRSITPGKLANGPLIHNPQKSIDIKNFGLFGYSVTSGRFFSRTDLFHVAGAPRSDYVGQVFVYSFPSKSHESIKTHQILSGDQHGEYFGASVAACDINGDNFDDLLVGAPLFAESLDEGRVLILTSRINLQKLIRPDDSLSEIKGTVQRGRLGTSISCLGDLDADGYNDVAIAAPYEGSGVVYIYKGSQKGLLSKPSQRVVGSKVSPMLSGFGYSLSRGQDVDKNGYIDLAVGAYRSGHTVLFRSRPVVDISVKIYPFQIPNAGLPRTASEFLLRTCPSYTGHSLPDTLAVIQVVELDPRFRRLYLDSQTTETSTVILNLDQSDSDNCRDLKVHLQKNIENFLEPLLISVSYNLVPENNTFQSLVFFGNSTIKGSDKFCASCPLLKPGSETKAAAQVQFQTDCGNDNICKSNVSAIIEFTDIDAKNTFIIGSSPTVKMRVTVSNAPNSNPAYNTIVEVMLSTPALWYPPQCQNVYNNVSMDGKLLSCTVANPLNNGTSREIDIILDMHSVTLDKKKLKYEAQVYTSSMNFGNATTLADIVLNAVADVTISGKSELELYYFDLKDTARKKQSNVTFNVRFQAEKLGPSPVDIVLVTVEIPVATKDHKNFLTLIKTELFRNNIEIPCIDNEIPTKVKREMTHEASVFTSSQASPLERTLFLNCTNSDLICTKVKCRVGPFPDKNTIARLDITLDLNFTALESELEQRDIVSLGTTANVVIEHPKEIEQPVVDSPDTVVVIITFFGHMPVGKIQMWIIIVSVIGGFLLLLLLIFGLAKVGFFKRHQKENLKNLKRETFMSNTDAEQSLTVPGSDTE